MDLGAWPCLPFVDIGFKFLLEISDNEWSLMRP